MIKYFKTNKTKSSKKNQKKIPENEYQICFYNDNLIIIFNAKIVFKLIHFFIYGLKDMDV